MGALIWVEKKRKKNAEFLVGKKEKNGCWMLWFLSLSLGRQKAWKEEKTGGFIWAQDEVERAVGFQIPSEGAAVAVERGRLEVTAINAPWKSC